MTGTSAAARAATARSMRLSKTHGNGRRLPCSPVRRLACGSAGGDGGFATLVVLGLSAVVVLLGATLVTLASVAVARARAASAADQGALAAAGGAWQGASAACGSAARVIEAVGASMMSCVLVAGTADVEVSLRPVGPIGDWGAARGRARAGPAHPG